MYGEIVTYVKYLVFAEVMDMCVTCDSNIMNKEKRASSIVKI